MSRIIEAAVDVGDAILDFAAIGAAGWTLWVCLALWTGAA